MPLGAVIRGYVIRTNTVRVIMGLSSRAEVIRVGIIRPRKCPTLIQS